LPPDIWQQLPHSYTWQVCCSADHWTLVTTHLVVRRALVGGLRLVSRLVLVRFYRAVIVTIY